jgi:hypothetical protein
LAFWAKKKNGRRRRKGDIRYRYQGVMRNVNMRGMGNKIGTWEGRMENDRDGNGSSHKAQQGL